MTTTDWIGFTGVLLILLAYVLNLSGRLDRERLAFILLNLAGSSLACWASVRMDYWPFIVLEGVWAGVSLLALIRLLFRKTPIA